MSYNIGQILFVVLTKKNQVYPMQVVEVINKKTLKGEEVRYSLQAGSDKSTNVFLDQLDGEVFESASTARKILTERATKQVERLVENAVTKSREWYGAVDVDSSVEPVLIEDIKKNQATPSDVNSAEVMLPDGTVAKIRLPGF